MSTSGLGHCVGLGGPRVWQSVKLEALFATDVKSKTIPMCHKSDMLTRASVRIKIKAGD
jgi:hypothetical protein